MSDHNLAGKDPSRAKTLEDHLDALILRRLIRPEAKWEVLERFYEELRERSALAVANAVEIKDQEIIRKEEVIKKKDEIIEELSQGPKLDKLTGLLQGDYFDGLLPKLVTMLCSERHTDRRSGCPTLVIGDVRGLKFYNDHPKLGHKVGDALISAVGHTIRNSIRLKDLARAHDFAARSNKQGDEFEILMVGARTPYEAFLAASRPKDVLNTRREWSEFHQALNTFRPNVDFGAAAIKGQSLRGILRGKSSEEIKLLLEDLILQWRRRAEILMYEAKESRSDSVSFAWFEYQDGELVNVTDQMENQTFLHLRADEE